MGIVRCIALFSLIVSTYAFAAESHLPIPHFPLPRPAQSDNFSFFGKNTKRNTAPAVDVSVIAAELKRQLDASLAPLSSPAPACSAPAAVEYALALQVSGAFEQCSQYVRGCASDLTSPRALWIGANCEITRGGFGAAEDYFKSATSARFANSSDYAEAVFQYAVFAMSHHQDQVGDILKLYPSWSPKERDLYAAIIKRAREADVTPFTKADVDKFLNEQIQTAPGNLSKVLKSLRLRITSRDYKHAEALRLLVADMKSFPDPLWYYRAYGVVYRAFDQKFAEARKIYDAFDPYANWSWDLPTEDNTYNYTEIYNQVCNQSLMQGPEKGDFNLFKDRLRKGELSPSQALPEIEKFVASFGGKADVLTTYAGILALLDRHDEAIDNYWKAHRACRYYNRANWGLELEQRRIEYTNRPDYAQNAARVERELSSKTIPAEITSYIVNWHALSDPAQRRVEYGARIWLPFMKPLLAENMRTYIKFAFDLLSESPGMESIADQRIGGTGYPNDNRLWDDVRGVGGETVVADLGEMFEAVQGEYNLLGHEVAHQFQGLLENKSPTGIQCVVDLYAAAKARGVFPDAYASQNKEEYFAQGVTYFLVPPDSPARFGLNQSWLKGNDPVLLDFVKSIDSSGGDLNQVSCSPSMRVSNNN